MNLVEIIGYIAIFFGAVYFINVFFEKLNKNTREIEEGFRLRDLQIAKSNEEKEQLEKWRSENKEAVQRIHEETERAYEQRQEVFSKWDESRDLSSELVYRLYVKGCDPREIFTKLQEIDPSKWAGIPVPEEMNIPEYDPSSPPWPNIVTEDVPLDCIRNINDIVQSYSVPVSDVSVMYSSYKTSLLKAGFPENRDVGSEAAAIVEHWLSDEEIQLAKSNLHQAVLNNIIMNLEKLKKIALRRKTVPVYKE